MYKYYPPALSTIEKSGNNLEEWLNKCPLDSKDIKPVNPKGNQPRIFMRRTAAKAPILWSSDAKNQLIKKRP